jgi:hypothetical protein
MTIREGAQRADVYHSGLLVFVYDEFHRAAINEAAPSVLDGFNRDEVLNDQALQKLARDGTLVVYELQQDDELDMEVVVGAALTEEELSIGLWEPVQYARFNLPSGRLCIESYDSLQLGDEEPTDEGAVLDVPPGDYVMTLHRIDWGALDDAEIEDYEGTSEVFVLSPMGQNAPPLPTDLPAMLLFPLNR